MHNKHSLCEDCMPRDFKKTVFLLPADADWSCQQEWAKTPSRRVWASGLLPSALAACCLHLKTSPLAKLHPAPGRKKKSTHANAKKGAFKTSYKMQGYVYQPCTTTGSDKQKIKTKILREFVKGVMLEPVIGTSSCSSSQPDTTRLTDNAGAHYSQGTVCCSQLWDRGAGRKNFSWNTYDKYNLWSCGWSIRSKRHRFKVRAKSLMRKVLKKKNVHKVIIVLNLQSEKVVKSDMITMVKRHLFRHLNRQCIEGYCPNTDSQD